MYKCKTVNIDNPEVTYNVNINGRALPFDHHFPIDIPGNVVINFEITICDSETLVKRAEVTCSFEEYYKTFGPLGTTRSRNERKWCILQFFKNQFSTIPELQNSILNIQYTDPLNKILNKSFYVFVVNDYAQFLIKNFFNSVGDQRICNFNNVLKRTSLESVVFVHLKIIDDPRCLVTRKQFIKALCRFWKITKNMTFSDLM